MSLLNKIKLNYNLKLFQEYIKDKKFEEAYTLIQDVKKKDEINFFLLLRNSQNLLNKLPPDFYKKKIIWTISYDLIDISYINNFLEYYLSKNLNLSFCFENFANSLNKYLTNLNPNSQDKNIQFDDFITQSNFFQNLLLFDINKDYLFLNTCASFFETSKKNYFIYPNITFCFFYIINKPENLLLRYKKNNNSIEASYDELFNYNDKQFLNQHQENQIFKVYENRKNINVNVKSWTDENVVNTYKGKIISYQRLLTNTEEVLIEILYHLKQYGMSLDVNIDDVKYFISNNEPIHNIDGVLSNKDLKFLNKNLDQTLDFFN